MFLRCPWGSCPLKAFLCGDKKAKNFFYCHILGLELTSSGTYRDLLWGFRERGGTRGGHTRPPRIPRTSDASPADNTQLGWGRGPPSPALPPRGLAPQLVLPPWEVPSTLRPAGAELKLVTSVSLAPWLWLPPTHPRVILQEPPDLGGTACYVLPGVSPAFLPSIPPPALARLMRSSPAISVVRGLVGGGPACSSDPLFPTPHSRGGTFLLQGAG